jgi:hypothetical protein
MNSPKIPTPAVCPRCGCWYQAGIQRCLDDGSALLQADNMVRLFGPEDMSSKNDTIVEVVVRAADPTESLGEAAARLKGGPSTMLMEEPDEAAPRPAAETTRPPEKPLVLEAKLGQEQTTLKPDKERDLDDEPPTRLVTVGTGAKPWVPLDPSEFELSAEEAPQRSPRWPRQPPGRDRVSFFEVSTRPEAMAEPDTEIVVDRDASSDLARLARHRRVTRRGYAMPSRKASRTPGRKSSRAPGLTQYTPTLLRTGTPPSGVKTG